jgi:hypothetical protein
MQLWAFNMYAYKRPTFWITQIWMSHLGYWTLGMTEVTHPDLATNFTDDSLSIHFIRCLLPQPSSFDNWTVGAAGWRSHVCTPISNWWEFASDIALSAARGWGKSFSTNRIHVHADFAVSNSDRLNQTIVNFFLKTFAFALSMTCRG